MDAAAPMLTGIVRPGLIFVLCRHRGIFAVANGACACLPAVHAGAGLRLGVAGVVFAGAGVGAVAVGGPVSPGMVEGFAVLGLANLTRLLRRAGRRNGVAVLRLCFAAVTAMFVGLRAVNVAPSAPAVLVLAQVLPPEDRQGALCRGQILAFVGPGVACGALVNVVLFQQLQHCAVGKLFGGSGLRFF